jgi:3-hydroxyisobutyrate dehydrogenase-like beta-hydroxyacid dehydrogenase
MTTAVIGTGGIGSVIARQLASGGETLRLSSATLSRHERWPRRSAAVRSPPPAATATRCRAPMPSSSRFRSHS